MRVSKISVYSQPRYCMNQPKKTNYTQNPSMTQTNNSVNFKGKFGALLGAVLGGAAVVAVALVAAPAAACLTGGGAFVGALGLDAAEDAVNGKDKKD